MNLNFETTDHDRLIFRRLRQTIINLQIIETWGTVLTFNTHRYCIKYRVEPKPHNSYSRHPSKPHHP